MGIVQEEEIQAEEDGDEASCSYMKKKRKSKRKLKCTRSDIHHQHHHQRLNPEEEEDEEEEEDDEEEDEFMDPSLWGGLPEDLHDRILARLPIPTLFRLRTVCRRWHSLLSPSTTPFLRLCTTSQQQQWLLMFADVHYKLVFVYLPEDNRWLRFPLHFLPSNIYYLTAAAGLLCFRLVEPSGASTMCVCNPLTRAWRRLPPLHGDFYAGLVGMTSDPDPPHRYRIVVRTKPPGSPDFDFTNLRTEVFDSVTGEWTLGGVPEDDLTMGKAVCNGVMYFMTWEARNGVYAYVVEDGVWLNISPPWPYFFTCPHLVECAGGVFMVGGFGKQHVSTVGIRVWQLRVEVMEWELVDSMPAVLFDRFLTRSGGMYFDCAGNGGCIYFVNYDKPPMLLVFDVARCVWRRVDTSPPSALHKMFLCFSFTPQLGCPVVFSDAKEPASSETGM